MVKQAVILVGGLGTRLGALTAQTPKPMVNIGGKPFLDYLLDEIGAQGFTDILLLTGYKSEIVASRYEGSSWRGAKIRCVQETSPLGTGGALVNARQFLDESFVMMNGDTFFDINLCNLVIEAKNAGGIGMMALRSNIGDRYGVVEWDGDLIHSVATPGKGGYINGGIYVLKKSILDFITHTPASIEADIFPLLAKQKLLHGRIFENFFIDIGIPEAFAQAQTSVPNQVMRPTLFFDRDGILNIDNGYVHKPSEFLWREGAIEAIKYLNDARWRVIVITNQAGVARGYYSEETVQKLHAWMNEILASHGAHIDAFYYCPHHPQGVVPEYTKLCECRKPKPGMIIKALEEWSIDKQRSLLIGDKDSDIEAANAAGVKGILLQAEDNLLEVVKDNAIQKVYSKISN